MNVLITGATGFIGIGVLAEALASDEVKRVVVLGRSSTRKTHPKLTEVLVEDFGDLSPVEDQLTDLDACLWCLGTSAVGLDEATYTRITHTYALHAARVLRKQNADLVFNFLSGSGADGRAMWARVKRRTEQDLRELGLAGFVIYRPAFIRGLHGAKMRGSLYRAMYGVALLVSPLARRMGGATSNKEIGQAMLVATRERLNDLVLDSGQINEVAGRLVPANISSRGQRR